ncbi:MAG: response regulator [Desulfocapsaceae bacterium]|nr:response regulator [Desulfocapsaceae bacterium]
MHVLVVDDDPFSREMTVAVLEDQGYNCQLAENGMEAMEILAGKSSCDLVISDMNMPLISGIDLFRELRSQGVTLPFILLTGDDPEGLQAQEPKLDACLFKDFSLEEILPQVINEVLSRC